MACQQLAATLRAHAAGGELPPDARAHLAHCEGCRQQLTRERDLLAVIDADIARALRVEPSPGFSAHIRERVAADALGRSKTTGLPDGWKWGLGGWRLALGGASLAAAAAATVALVVLSLGNQPVSRVPAPPRPEVTKPAPKPIGPGLVETPARGVAQPRLAAGAKAKPPRTTTARAAEPEVLVPPDERLALARFLAMIDKGHLSASDLPDGATGGPSEQPLQVAPIVLQELKVAPIDIGPVSGGTRR